LQREAGVEKRSNHPEKSRRQHTFSHPIRQLKTRPESVQKAL